MSIIKRFIKWTGITITTILLIPFLLAALLYIPPIQNWAVKKAIDITSEQTGIDINLSRVGISFPLDIELSNLTAAIQGDTLLHTSEIVIDMDFENIFHGQLGIEGIDIANGAFNTFELIPELNINGTLGLLHLDREDTDLRNGIAHLSKASIDECVLNISMSDTIIADTTESTAIPWTIKVGGLNITNSHISFRSAGDTISVGASINKAWAKAGDIKLLEGQYLVESIGLDLDSLNLCIKDSIGTDTNIPLSCTSLRAENLYMDTLALSLHHFGITTGKHDASPSQLLGSIYFDFNSLTSKSNGRLSANIEAALSHREILDIAGGFIPADLARIYPEQPLNANISLNGNIDSLHIDTIHLQMPTTFNLQGQGYVADILATDSIRAHFTWFASTGKLDFVRKYLQLSGINIPSMKLEAETRINGNKYEAEATINRGHGTLQTQAYIDLNNMAYNAVLYANEINIRDFLPNDSLGKLTFSAKVKGHGTDLMSKATGFNGEFDLKHLEYKNWNIDNARLTALLKRGKANVDLHCDNEILMTNACVNANIDKENSQLDFALSLNKINFQALGVSKDSVIASMVLNIDGGTDMKQHHRLVGSMHSIELATPDTTYYPLDLNIEIKTNDKDVLARTNAGNLWFQFHASEGMDSLVHKLNDITTELNKQHNTRVIDYTKIQELLPKIDFHVLCGNNNPLANVMRSMFGTRLNEMAFDLVLNPTTGVNGKAHIHKLITPAVILDSISMDITQLSEAINIKTRVKNGPRNKVVNFESTLNALITTHGIETSLVFLDGKGHKGIDLGVNLETTDSLFQISLTPLNPILAYRKFNVNADNHITINQKDHIQANMNLLADDGTALRLYSLPDTNAEQDITLSITNFNLGELSNVLPFMPMITGMLNGDIHAVKETEQATLSVDMDVKEMGYEGSPLGDIGLGLIYFPNNDGSHLVDGILSQNQRDIILVNGRYWTENKEGQIEAEAHLQRLPLNMANGFITDNLARLEGYISGILDVRGPVSLPQLSGALSTDSMHICSDPYSISLRLPDDTIVIQDNLLDLDKIQAYANGNNPLTLNGTIDFRDLEKAKLNLNIVARDFNLINAPKRKDAEAYGKVYVDILGVMQGTLDNLNIRGRLNVNGKTNVTYVMKDSPLIVEDQLSSMVTFTDFSDTLALSPMRLPEQNIKMDWQLNIDEATTIHCLLSEDGQDKIDLEGGGELRMTYDMLSGMKLFGRYTVLSGRMDYSLIVVSLKNFQIDNGSFVEFSGDMFDPKLNISASERKKASVTTNNVTRTVNFDVGLKISQTLSDLGLEFTLKAPEDITVQNELSSMSVEERGRAAVAMLTTGMYLSSNGSGGGGNFDATSALNSFLNSQISNIAGKALSTIDIGFGIDNTTSATGAAQTDYNFSFAKRFWGNRISIIIGGKVSSGNDARNTGMSIIDNVSIEYRLDNSGTRYVKAFYNKDTESILDSEVMEMGASLVLRKKTENLSELFIFRDTKKKQNQQRLNTKATK